jgi:hypothetical protein
MTKPMPGRKAKESPEFDEDQPEGLTRFFDELEQNFKMAGISDDEEKKKWVGRYVTPKLEVEWQTLPTFKKGTYEEYKKEITNEYPEVVTMNRGSIKKLKQICEAHQRIGFEDLGELLKLKRQFRAEAAKLTAEPALLANRGLVEYFLGCLTRDFRERVYSQLEANHRTDARIAKKIAAEGTDTTGGERSRPEDKFLLEEVISMAEELARDRNPGQYVNLNPGPSRSMDTVPTVKAETMQQERALEKKLHKLEEEVAGIKDLHTVMQKSILEEMRQGFQQFQAQTVAAAAAAAPPMRQYYAPRPQAPYLPRAEYQARADHNHAEHAHSGPGTCYYCGKAGHLFRDCPLKEIHVKENKIEQRGFRVVLPDGTPLNFDPNKPGYEKVEEFHNKSKAPVGTNYFERENGILQFSQIQMNSPGTSLYNNKPSDNRDDYIASLAIDNHNLSAYINGDYGSLKVNPYKQKKNEEREEYQRAMRQSQPEMWEAMQRGDLGPNGETGFD